MGHMWDRWVWAFTKSNDSESEMFMLDYGKSPSTV